MPAPPLSVGVVSFVMCPTGGAVRVTPGCVVSTVNRRGALYAVSELLSSWVAYATYVPSASAGDADTDHEPSTAERVALRVCTSSSAAPATGRYTSTFTVAESPAAVLAWPLKIGVESPVSASSAGTSSVTFAPEVSTAHVRDAGVGSTFPTSSMARTSKVCTSLESPVYDCGEGHGVQDPPSSRHSNVEPLSLAENVKLAEVAAVEPCGLLEIEVCGGVVSTVNEVAVLTPVPAVPSCSAYAQ